MNTTSLADKMLLKSNCFDFIRLFASVLVIFSHSYGLLNIPEPYSVLSSNAFTLGEIAVLVFFLISGFLITKSWDDAPNLIQYFKKRLLRIVPALFVVIILLVFCIGPFVSNLNIHNYFFSPDTWKYLLNIIPLKFFEMKHAFVSNPFPHSINGSLWSLSYEFRCYILVAVLGIFNFYKQDKKFILFIMLFLILLCFNPYKIINRCYVVFLIGQLFYLFREKIILSKYIALSSLILLILTIKMPTVNTFIHIIAISYLTFFLAYNTGFLNNFKKFGDFSYGVYIYAFPIQQILILNFIKELSPIKLFIISTLITLIFAVISWFFIEKKALQLKNSKLVPFL